MTWINGTALADFERAMKHKEDGGGALREHWRLLIALRRYEAGVKDADLLMRVDKRPAPYVMKAECLVPLKRYQKLLTTANDGLKLYPAHGELYYFQAVAYSNLKRYPEALKSMNTCLKLPAKRSKHRYYKLRAEIHAAMGHKELAAADDKYATSDIEFGFKHAPFAEKSIK